MSITWQELGAQGQSLAAAHFLARSVAAQLDDAAAVRPIAPRFADLYAWVTDPEAELPAEQQAIVAADPVLRRSLALLVGRVGQLRAVAAAAASSGGLDQRSGQGFSVKLTASRADAAQTYVTVEIDPAALAAEAPPRLLLVLRGEVLVGRVTLPEFADGVAQAMAGSDGAAVRGLRAADTELVLV